MLRLEAETGSQGVVLEVPPHAREIDDRVDAESLEVILRADAGQQEQPRRMDRPGAKDHLPGRADGMRLAVHAGNRGLCSACR